MVEDAPVVLDSAAGTARPMVEDAPVVLDSAAGTARPMVEDALVVLDSGGHGPPYGRDAPVVLYSGGHGPPYGRGRGCSYGPLHGLYIGRAARAGDSIEPAVKFVC